MVFSLFALALIASGAALVWPYYDFEKNDGGYLEQSLEIFTYNESKHFVDPVPGCWYDSGDYIVFTQRNARTLYYLSLAYAEAKDASAKTSLLRVIDRQLGCFDGLLERNIKQIRDQRSHIAIVPPIVNQIVTPQSVYYFRDGEGRDVYLLRSLIAKNLGDEAGARIWLKEAEKKTDVTMSEKCCEEGPLHLSEKSQKALELLVGLKDTEEYDGGWGIDLSNITLIESGDFFKVRDILEDVRDAWDGEVPRQFDYIGGNYDIAGTIALERLYAKKTGDRQFKRLSDDLFAYLHGVNGYDIHFTEYKTPHHPCGEWWARCSLSETLINGIDESLEFDTSRRDIWRLTEVQLTGQAEYVFALILYLEI